MSREKLSEFFQNIYKDRWPALLESLQKKERQVARINSFSQDDLASKFAGRNFVKELANCFWLEASQQPERTTEELLDLYIMDPGSVFVAKALDVQPGDRVLDMCAAPGGKSLILAEALKDNGELIANDLSPERRERLKKVFQQYIPRHIRERFWIKGQDGVQFGLKEPGQYDRVLLDAPCSGERHLLENEAALKEWSPRRTEHLASRQYALLAAAFLAVREGGRIVYSTCSISPAENDEVVARLIKKKKGEVQLVKMPSPHPEAEITDCGYIFMPDRSGFGPLYFAVLEKTSK